MSDLDRKTLATLFFSVFATVTGVGIVVPLLPVYAHALGAGGFYIGLIFGAFSLSRTLFIPLFGRLSDTKGRKTFILPGLFAYALISLAYAFSSNATTLIVIRFFHGVASAMLMPVIQAYVADVAPVGREGRIMGLFSTCILLGLSLGPIIGGLVTDAFGMRSSFVCMGALAMIGFIMCLRLLPSRAAEQTRRTPREPRPWRRLLADRSLAALFVFRFTYVVCIGIIWGFLPLYAAIKLSASSSTIALLITIGVLVSGVLNSPMGLVADRISRRLMVAVGGLIAAGAIFSLQYAETYRHMAFAAGVFGIGGGISTPALMALAASKGEASDSMGSVMALMTAGHSLGMLAGALLAGIMMDMFSLPLAFTTGAIVLVTGTIFFVIAGARHNPVQPAKTLDAVSPVHLGSGS